MSKSNKNINEKIPVFQILYFVILLLLIIFRILFKNMTLYINLANYISMVISVSIVILETIFKIQEKRRKNICKCIFIIILIIFISAATYILTQNVEIPTILNDIFTLIALMFCVCNKVLESILLGLTTFIKA